MRVGNVRGVCRWWKIIGEECVGEESGVGLVVTHKVLVGFGGGMRVCKGIIAN